MSIQAVLALYASGRTTGIVLDSGDGVTHAVPVYEGFSMPHAIKRVDVAGRDVTEQLQVLLRKAGYHLSTTAEKEVVRIIKEKACYVALNPAKEEKEAAGGGRGEDFRLPDGNVVRVRSVLSFFLGIGSDEKKLGAERFRAPEILFNPELNGQEYAGIHQVVVDSINRTDLDLRKSLFSNIVLSGGSTLTRGACCLFGTLTSSDDGDAQALAIACSTRSKSWRSRMSRCACSGNLKRTVAEERADQALRTAVRSLLLANERSPLSHRTVNGSGVRGSEGVSWRVCRRSKR